MRHPDEPSLGDHSASAAMTILPAVAAPSAPSRRGWGSGRQPAGPAPAGLEATPWSGPAPVSAPPEPAALVPEPAVAPLPAPVQWPAEDRAADPAARPTTAPAWDAAPDPGPTATLPFAGPTPPLSPPAGAPPTPPSVPGAAALWQQAPRRRRPPLWVVGLVLLAVVLAATGGWLVLRPDPDADYLTALRAAGLTSEYASSPAAIAHGRSFCRKLEGGADPTGFRAERVATKVYCPSFLVGFTVVPTPKEQQDSYLTDLRDAGFGGEYGSDDAAVAAAHATCTRLEGGGKQQGLPVEAVALPVYCPSFAAGFKSLETITVEGTFTLTDSSIYSSSIFASDGDCTGTGGYSDIHSGTQVVVKDDDGKTVAKASLGHGSGSSYRCTFSFSFDLLEGSEDYSVQVSHRGELDYTFTQLKDDGLELSL
ncbi:MAG: Conserved rane protein of unknown function [Frankiales bacterium]|nr:Conserved rane protein of unknown function [Frankiales bacterium]